MLESLESVPTPPSAELLNKYEKITAKLGNHFIPMANLDCARSKLEKINKKKRRIRDSVSRAFRASSSQVLVHGS